MKQSKFTDEQIIGFLKQADAGMSVKELCLSSGFSQPTFYKWRSRFGCMEPSDAAKLRELKAEETRISQTEWKDLRSNTCEALDTKLAGLAIVFAL